jgi:hypothetical protein
MSITARKLLEEGKTFIRMIGDRGIERHFQKVDQFKCAPTKKLSDFVLIHTYKALQVEIDNEANSGVRRFLVKDLLEAEEELKKRNLFDKISLS